MALHFEIADWHFKVTWEALYLTPRGEFPGSTDGADTAADAGRPHPVPPGFFSTWIQRGATCITSRGTSPLPPRQNCLQLPIEAGKLTYHPK